MQPGATLSPFLRWHLAFLGLSGQNPHRTPSRFALPIPVVTVQTEMTALVKAKSLFDLIFCDHFP